MNQSTLSDAELLRLLVAGDEHAFAQIYGRYQASVYKFALLMSGSANLAEEVTQEVFLLLIREPHRYNPAVGPLQAYLYGVARNHVTTVLTARAILCPIARGNRQWKLLPSTPLPRRSLWRLPPERNDPLGPAGGLELAGTLS